jgi:hypothetical protein
VSAESVRHRTRTALFMTHECLIRRPPTTLEDERATRVEMLENDAARADDRDNICLATDLL